MFLWEKMQRISSSKSPPGSCRVINGLIAELLEDLEKDGNNCCTLNTISDTHNMIENQIYLEEEPDLKQGIKLPTSSREWELTNDFFKFSQWEERT